MFRRTVIAEFYNSQILFDIADNAAGNNWYRMGANHQMVNNNATVNTYKIRFKPSGGFPGTAITPSLIPYFFYRIEGEQEAPANWNAVVEMLNNPENYTIVRTICTHNNDGYWYGTLTLEKGFRTFSRVVTILPQMWWRTTRSISRGSTAQERSSIVTREDSPAPRLKTGQKSRLHGS